MLKAAAAKVYQTGLALMLGAAFALASPSALARKAPEVSTTAPGFETITLADLPRDGRTTYARILQGGPFSSDKDGSVFGNRERILPRQSRGYYREYTVRTPGARNRGARRSAGRLDASAERRSATPRCIQPSGRKLACKRFGLDFKNIGAGIVQRVKKIVDNLKDFSRVDTAEWHFADLENGLESTLNIVWNEIKYKAEVEKEYAGLPEIECIASQLNQVFMNLLLNAIQATPRGGTVSICASEADANMVAFDICDTGPGMPESVQEHIFEPFFSTKEVGKGTGLGLAVTYALVHRYEGEISVRSSPGQGAVFTVLLPRVGGCLRTTGKE